MQTVGAPLISRLLRQLPPKGKPLGMHKPQPPLCKGRGTAERRWRGCYEEKAR